MRTPRFIIAEHRPGKGLIVVLGGLILVLIGLVFGYWLASSNEIITSVSNQGAVSIKSLTTAAKEPLVEQNQKLLRTQKLNQQANELLRQEIERLQNNIYNLEKELSLFHAILAPKEHKQGLTVGSLELSSDATSNSYSYKVVLIQSGAKHGWVAGKLLLSVLGSSSNGAEQWLPWSSLAPKTAAPVYRFRYFQNIEGVIKLPENFSAKQIAVKLVNNQGKSIRKLFDWAQVMERKRNVQIQEIPK